MISINMALLEVENCPYCKQINARGLKAKYMRKTNTTSQSSVVSIVLQTDEIKYIVLLLEI